MDSMSSLGVEVKDLGYYMDILSNAQNRSNTTATALMEAYIGCGGTLKELGTSLEESSTLLGIMANRGLKGSEAGNALNSILINLTKKSGESADALKQMGISAFDTEGKFKGITPVLQEVNNAFANMTEEQKTNYASMIAGKTQITGFRALLSGLSQEYGTLYNAQQNATGALEEMYNVMNNNTQGKIQEFKSNLESFGLQLADVLLPHINTLLEKGMQFVDWLKTLSPETLDATVKIIAFTAGLGGILKVTGGIIQNGGAVINTFGGILKATGKGIKNVRDYKNAFEELIAKVRLFTGDGGINSVWKFVDETRDSMSAGGRQLVDYAGKFLKLKGVLLGSVATLAVVGASIYATSQYLKTLSRTGLKAREDMSWLERAIIDLGGGVSYTKKELEEMGLVQKKASDNLKGAFKKSVDGAIEDVQKFGFELKQVNLDNVMTEEECNSFVERVAKASDSAIKAVEERNTEIKDKLNEIFNSDNKIDTYEQTIMSYYTRSGDKNKEEVQRMQNEINELLRKVREEGYVLTPADEQMITEYYAEIKRIELEAQADAEDAYEREYALSQFKKDLYKADAEDYSKILQEKSKARDKELDEIDNDIDGQIAVIRQGYNEMNYAEQKAVDAKIATLEKERKDRKEITLQSWNETLQIAENANADLFKVLDEQSGKVLEGQELDNKKILDGMRERYHGINEITKDGMYQLYNESTKSWDNVYVNVDENTGKIVGCVQYLQDEYGLHAGEVGACNDDIKKSTDEMAEEAKDSYNMLSNALKNAEGLTVDSAGKIRKANGEVVGSLDDITESADGTKEGIVMLNGTPVKVKFDDKTGTIKNANDIKDAIDEIPTNKTVKVTIDQIFNGDPVYYSDGRGNRTRIYATGTSNAPEGVAQVNEAGYELIDSVTSSARALAGTMAYLPSHTKVTNHLMTTLKMKADIKKEVAKAMAGIDNGSVVNEIVVNSGDIVVNGNLDNVTLDDLDKVIAKNNAKLKDNIYSELNKVAKKY